MKKHVLALGLLISSMAGAANASLIVNGSFEEGDWSGATDSAYKRLLTGNTSLTGWEIDGVGVDWHNNAHFGPLLFGDKAVDLNLNDITTAGSLSQSFSTDIGGSYSLKFFMAAPGMFETTRDVKVNIAGVERVYSMPSADRSSLSWQDFSLNFEATSTVTTLMFSSVNGRFWGPVLDNVSVERVDVPEPATMFLFVTGLLGLAGCRRIGKR